MHLILSQNIPTHTASLYLPAKLVTTNPLSIPFVIRALVTPSLLQPLLLVHVRYRQRVVVAGNRLSARIEC